MGQSVTYKLREAEGYYLSVPLWNRINVGYCAEYILNNWMKMHFFFAAT